MKLMEIIQTPKFIVRFSTYDVDQLRRAALKHYDPHVRLQVEPGGIIFGMIDALYEDTVTADLSWGQLDLFCKTLESEDRTPLKTELRSLLKTAPEFYQVTKAEAQ